MSLNNNFAEEDSNIQNNVMSVDEFTREVLEYFKSVLKNSLHRRHKDQSALIRQSWNHFGPVLKDERLEDVYIEVLFSVFEIFPFTSHEVIRDVLKNYLLRKMDEYCYMKKELTQDIPLSISLLSYIDYYLDPLDEYMVTSVEHFCSPPMILDFCVMKRWLRNGARFQMNPLETRYYLTNILSCITVKLLPLLYKDVEWDVSRIIFAYGTYNAQRRLYWVLLFVYVILQSSKPDVFPKWQSCIRSLKLVFKASTEPLITAQEIGRFLRVAAVSEIDERVSEDLFKKFAVEFPNIKDPSGPRSLKQISRCTVRDVLIKSRTLPHGVWYLDIPTKLKNYLLFQEREDEFYPAYVHALGSRKRSAPHQISAKRSRTSV